MGRRSETETSIHSLSGGQCSCAYEHEKSNRYPPSSEELGNAGLGYRAHLPHTHIHTHRSAYISLHVDESGVASLFVVLVSRLLINPSPPVPPRIPSASLPFSLIPDCPQVWNVPPLLAAACPPCLAHEADHGLFLRPPLLNSDIRKVCCTHSSTMIGERDTQAMRTQIPI